MNRRFNRAWKRSGAREAAWRGRPSHSLRKGFSSGLLGLGADADAVEVLLGHKLAGVRAHYIDPGSAFDLRGTVKLIPRIPGVGTDDQQQPLQEPRAHRTPDKA